jgi:hypothetical protein
VLGLRVTVVVGQDGAAASKDDEQQQAPEETLKRVQHPATGIGRIENGAGDVAHGEAV